MENLINWFEIPAMDFSRAASIYRSILGLEVKETEMSDTLNTYMKGGNDLQNVWVIAENSNGILMTQGVISGSSFNRFKR